MATTGPRCLFTGDPAPPAKVSAYLTGSRGNRVWISWSHLRGFCKLENARARVSLWDCGAALEEPKIVLRLPCDSSPTRSLHLAAILEERGGSGVRKTSMPGLPQGTVRKDPRAPGVPRCVSMVPALSRALKRIVPMLWASSLLCWPAASPCNYAPTPRLSGGDYAGALESSDSAGPPNPRSGVPCGAVPAPAPRHGRVPGPAGPGPSPCLCSCGFSATEPPQSLKSPEDSLP